jgi:hypothetical protein
MQPISEKVALMKTDITTSSGSVAVSNSSSGSQKLGSLLALAAGAVAMPQSSQADIIYTDMNANPVQVGFLGGGASFIFTNVPSTVLFGFERDQKLIQTTSPFTTSLLYRTVYARSMFGADFAWLQAGPNGMAAPLNYGVPWNAAAPLTFTVTMGWANTYFRSPSSGYDHMYLAWKFLDGGAARYGWIEVGLSIVNVNPFGSSGGPNVTIYGYAYDNTGALPFMGQRNAVPEPSSAAMLMIGALALGAPGLRRWRQSRQMTSNS